MAKQQVNIGLEGVLVGETRLSNVEGEVGRLSYRGVDIKDLVNMPYLAVTILLILGRQPSDEEQRELEQFLIKEGALIDFERTLLQQLPPDLHPMLMLQSMVPVLSLQFENLPGFIQQQVDLNNHQLAEGLIISAKIPNLIAAWHRLQTGKEVDELSTDQTLANNFHARFLQQFTGRAPTDLEIQTLDKVQILQLEHGMNAGTFAGRVVASTQAPIQSVIAASIGALFGKLHGGADQAAVEMALAIGSPDMAAEYVQQKLTANEKIMGMGHREYKVVDPRASVLKPMARRLCSEGENKNLLQILETVENLCRQHFELKGKDIWANVEFYKGAVFKALGIPPHFFTAMFAMARVNGYIAHFLEFNRNPRLIRPQVVYTGD